MESVRSFNKQDQVRTQITGQLERSKRNEEISVSWNEPENWNWYNFSRKKISSRKDIKINDLNEMYAKDANTNVSLANLNTDLQFFFSV